MTPPPTPSTSRYRRPDELEAGMLVRFPDHVGGSPHPERVQRTRPIRGHWLIRTDENLYQLRADTFVEVCGERIPGIGWIADVVPITTDQERSHP